MCKLVKALYSLKHAPIAWYKILKEILLSKGFVNSTADHCLFHNTVGGKMTLILVYVDNILIAEDDQLVVQDLITALH